MATSKIINNGDLWKKLRDSDNRRSNTKKLDNSEDRRRNAVFFPAKKSITENSDRII